MTALDRLDRKIHVIRGIRVMLDIDLAEIYGVKTFRLNEQVKRNPDKFPEEFAFRLTREEKAEVIAKCDNLSRLKFSPACPLAFTEHGAIMAATVLNSPAAVAVSIHVVKTFVRLRQTLDANKSLAKKLDELGAHVSFHDKAIAVLFDEIKKLAMPMEPDEEESPKRRIGFHRE